MIYISTYKKSAIMLAVAVVLSCTTIILSLAFNNKSEKVIKSAETTQKIEYILKNYNGHLAVFYSDEDTPYREFEIPVSSFSDYDQDLLMQGIYADSEEKINKLIEDYTS